MFAATATFCDAGTPGETSLCSRLHNHDLPCNENPNRAVIRALKIQDQCETLHYTYLFITSNEMRRTLGDPYTSGF